MKFDREIHEQYQKAYAMAVRCQQKNKKQSLPVCPVSLDSVLNERMVSYRQDLGVMEIPTDLIIGVTEKSNLMLLFTREFLPVSLPNTEEAEQWRQAYGDVLSKKCGTETICCLEYLGKFYVSDGLMKVSAAKFLNVPMMQAQVIRVMPIKTDSIEVKRYYDFLSQYRITDLYQLQFTQSGFFEEMEKAFGKKPAEQWTEGDRAALLNIWPKVESAFRSSYADYLPITTADAFVVLLRKFSFRQLLRMDSWILARVFQACWKDLYSLGGTDSRMRQETHSRLLQTA